MFANTHFVPQQCTSLIPNDWSTNILIRSHADRVFQVLIETMVVFDDQFLLFSKIAFEIIYVPLRPSRFAGSHAAFNVSHAVLAIKGRTPEL